FLKDLEEMRAFHCTYIVHTFSENDHLFCKQAVGEIVQATKDAGLTAWVDPWGVGRVFGGEAFSNFTGLNPDSVQIANDGVPTHCACPNAPKFRDFMAKWIDDAVEIGAEVLFWDEPHFYMPSWLGGRPGTWACTCAHCHARWEERHPGEPFPTTLSEKLEEAREDWIVDFLRFLTDKTAAAGIASAVCLLPIEPKHPHATANWEKVASLPSVSIIGTDPYWMFDEPGAPKVGHTLDNYVRPHTEKVMALAKAHGLRAQMWLQGFKIPAGREGDLLDTVDVFVEGGCRDIATWGFDACQHISWIRPADPAKVWATVGEAYARVKDLS
ncbi:MAG: hypothetical protein GY851_36445, partial [bacterium]|nr:hypothetical protein [bacterium]